MWIREPLIIEVADNTVTPIGLEFWDEVADIPLDITGYTFTCNVAQGDGSTRLASFPAQIIDAVNGEVDFSCDGSVFGNARGARTFVGQLIATDTLGESVTAARIVFLVEEGIS